MCEKIFKDGICISESLGKCKGCQEEFFKDLSEAGFKGLKITDKGIERF